MSKKFLPPVSSEKGSFHCALVGIEKGGKKRVELTTPYDTFLEEEEVERHHVCIQGCCTELFARP